MPWKLIAMPPLNIQPDGSLIVDECHYNDLEQYIQTGLLEFCGCGQPEKALAYVQAGLQFIKWQTDQYQSTDRTQLRPLFDKVQKRELEVFGSEAGAYFFYYVMDQKELIEHGGSVPGWLSNKGEELLALLESLHKES